MTKIIILGGGNSTERDVSLRSSRAVYQAALQAGFSATILDPRDGLSALDAVSKDTIILPILHGAGGEDGTIQKELEKRGLAYLGADSKTSELCFNKANVRELLQEHDVSIAEGGVVDKNTYRQNVLSKRPHVLKVNRGGSSIGTYIVHNPASLDEKKVSEVFGLDNQAILEELVDGVEITVPVIGDTALPVIEIQPPKNADFDYMNKYNGQTSELCPPQNVSKELQHKAQALAEKVHHLTGCRHLSRTDMIVRPNGEIVVLEINTIPGMTDQSLLPKSANVAGISFPELVKRFVELVQVR